MILFATYHQEAYNCIFHHFLKLEIFNGQTDVGDIIEEILPKYLYREQYHKCVKTIEELYYWTGDKFYHEMNAFHEFILYKFIDYMGDLQKELPDFNRLYFNERCRILIKEASQKDFEEDSEFSLEEHEESFYDVFYYPDVLFTDTDFLMIDTLYNQRKLGNINIENSLGINIDYYFELLPIDIQEQYKTKHITLTGEVSSMLKYITERLKYGNLYKLFWENEDPVREERIQLILENIMDAYFYNQAVEITREAMLGNGKVDFKLYKNTNEDEKVLIEIKKAKNYVKKGYEKQLTDYMLSTKYKNAFYLIACFTDDEYDKSMKFIREHVYTDTIQLYINISILDFRKRKSASIS
ncbi:hypothetical protein [Paenibacillus riograndensis]|uniref:Uncharacterized protein n=1 Tax=Paenibacillus riograndensis SBR5 TaxID=1073571 RepID=A0A0E3WGC6_9BACL|nr:hypothetical protein [Paenibacillus riograndensis]CQR52528.1 hypothetical protein PRIO_0869 [Paenibacillus riograndensis SBR5]